MFVDNFKQGAATMLQRKSGLKRMGEQNWDEQHFPAITAFR